MDMGLESALEGDEALGGALGLGAALALATGGVLGCGRASAAEADALGVSTVDVLRLDGRGSRRQDEVRTASRPEAMRKRMPPSSYRDTPVRGA